MMMQSDQTAAGPAAKFLTETDQLVFVMEEVTRRLRRIFDTSVEQFGLTRT